MADPSKLQQNGYVKLTNDQKRALIRQVENTIEDSDPLSCQKAIQKVAEKNHLSKNRVHTYYRNKEAILKACDNGFGSFRSLPSPVWNEHIPGKKAKFKTNVSIPTDEQDNLDWPEIQSYMQSDRYLCAEIGVFYSTKIEGYAEYAGEKCESGSRAGERFTVMAIGDQTGNDLTDLIVVGNSSNLLKKKLPVKYHCNEEAWMTSEIFETEIRQWDEKLREDNRKILLFAEKSPAHPRVRGLKNIKIVNYENKTNAPIEMVRCMKANYRRNIMKHYERNPEDKCDNIKAIFEMRQAWKSVMPEEVLASFIEAGLISGDKKDVYSTVLERLSQVIRKDPELLKAYTEFDDQLLTSAPSAETEGCDELEDGELPVSSEEAGEAVNTVLAYCRQKGRLYESRQSILLDIELEIRKDSDEWERSQVQNQGHSGSTANNQGAPASKIPASSNEQGPRNSGQSGEHPDKDGSSPGNGTNGGQDKDKTKNILKEPLEHLRKLIPQVGATISEQSRKDQSKWRSSRPQKGAPASQTPASSNKQGPRNSGQSGEHPDKDRSSPGNGTNGGQDKDKTNNILREPLEHLRRPIPQVGATMSEQSRKDQSKGGSSCPQNGKNGQDKEGNAETPREERATSSQQSSNNQRRSDQSSSTRVPRSSRPRHSHRHRTSADSCDRCHSRRPGRGSPYRSPSRDRSRSPMVPDRSPLMNLYGSPVRAPCGYQHRKSELVRERQIVESYGYHPNHCYYCLQDNRPHRSTY